MVTIKKRIIDCINASDTVTLKDVEQERDARIWADLNDGIVGKEYK